MRYYINGIATYSDDLEFKALIPDANMRRRMSRVLKMGVSTGISAVNSSNLAQLDAVITATGLGCLTDSEKFLKSIIESDERLLNPTPFIQSTFNTIGGQIALIKGLNCYNVTYSHRYSSFEAALVDGAMQLEEGADNILIGGVDEVTPTQINIMERLNCYTPQVRPLEGAYFFILSRERSSTTVAAIEISLFKSETVLEDDIDRTLLLEKGSFIASAKALFDAVELLNDYKRLKVECNDNIKIVISRC